MEQHYCSVCHQPIVETYYFCPNCGKKIHEPPPSTTITKQLSIYAVSILLPPLGLWPGIRYLRQPDQKTRMIGWIAIILTVVSTVVTVRLTLDIMNMMQTTIQDQLQPYGGL